MCMEKKNGISGRSGGRERDKRKKEQTSRKKWTDWERETEA